MKSQFRYRLCSLGGLFAGALLGVMPSASGQISGYYVGYDDQPTVFAPASYRGLPNPNRGKITLFYPHAFADNRGQNHFHNIGTYSYSGPTNDLKIVPTNSNTRIPEVGTRQPPLTLVAGKGAWVGKLVSASTAEHYSTMRFRSVQALRFEKRNGQTNEYGYGSPEWHMLFNRFGPQFANFDNAVYSKVIPAQTLAVELVSLTPGLNIGLATNTTILANPGDRHLLGDANEFDFQPVFWTDASAAPGRYTVAWKFVDVSEGSGSLVPESGISHVDFRVAASPELVIEKTVRLTMPVVIDGHVLESATSPDGPWTPVAQKPSVNSAGSGEGAAQLGTASLVLPSDKPG
ncbi:MAG: hypothetical protein FJ405_17150, partial [Verrucomicrobia bacterium]|nr:hypothetical protein [Verrucomicrobiota bacterium]